MDSAVSCRIRPRQKARSEDRLEQAETSLSKTDKRERQLTRQLSDEGGVRDLVWVLNVEEGR
jgi:hypothetical protein